MADQSRWRSVRFGLIVTGRGEHEFLAGLFRSIVATAHEQGWACEFRVLARIEQRKPHKPVPRLKEVGPRRQRTIEKDTNEIGLRAWYFLQDHDDSFVILVDDIERLGLSQAPAVFERYRLALDEVLARNGLSAKASVHFFVKMLEAYFLADADAVNAAFGGHVIDEHDGDVEEIPNPKARLSDAAARFFRSLPRDPDSDEPRRHHEIEHGSRIVARLDVPRILSRPDRCAALRSLVGWCWRALGFAPDQRFRLVDGAYDPVTKDQIDRLPST